MSLVSKWYVSVEDKAKGPYSDLQMRERIKSGEFKEDTLTYKEGEPDWLPLSQQDIWTPGFVPKHPLESKSSKDWVLLVESPIKKGDYQQQGPFTEKEVQEKVQIGEVHLKDFCWKPGMAEWSPLVETFELGFPRKDKITFKNDEKVETLTTLDLVNEKEEKTKKETSEFKWDLKSHMPDFVSPKGLVKEKPDKVFRTKFLPPIIDREGAKKEVLSYLILIMVSFVAAFYLGSLNSRAILNGVETFGEKLSTMTEQILPSAPKVSYVILRRLPLTRGTVLIKTDGKLGTKIKARVQTEDGAFVKTKQGYLSLEILTDEKGEAQFKFSDFNVKLGQTYLLTTKVGHLKASKTYFYSNN